MSLLLDALKRAEEAKKAQRDANETSSTSTGNEPISLAPLDEQSGLGLSEGEVPPPLMTRDKLPNISQSMSILPEDFSVPLKGEEKRGENSRRPRTEHPTKQSARGASLASAQADRNTARQLFEAKAPNYDPRRPFYIMLGALGIFAVGAIAYFWYQLQPPAFASRQATPSQNAIERTTEARGASNTQSISNAALAATAAASSTTATANDAAVIPVEPQAPTRLTPAPRETLTAPTAPAQRDTRNADHITLVKSKPQGPSAVEQGYAAFEGGDLVAARSHYQAALTQDPLSRDALLGLAAIDMHEQHYTSAEARYVRLLEIDPRDPYAHAGLIGLRGRSDPVATESRIKNLLAQRPDANVLHFTLGNQYAIQGRWPEAQQAYFKAYSTDPANPDYAFNLAVSLDQLRQSKLALEYYQKALALASARPATFLPSQAEARIRELNR
jgi:tetratricopeptide (TPR) repeat protein